VKICNFNGLNDAAPNVLAKRALNEDHRFGFGHGFDRRFVHLKGNGSPPSNSWELKREAWCRKGQSPLVGHSPLSHCDKENQKEKPTQPQFIIQRSSSDARFCAIARTPALVPA